MLVANYSDVRNRLKHYCDQIYNKDEMLIVTRKEARNIVMMSLERYNRMEKLIQNAEYYTRLSRADEQIKAGKVVIKTMDELEAMAE